MTYVGKLGTSTVYGADGSGRIGGVTGGGGGGGSTPAIDANHVYVYACNDVSGSTIINTGTSGSADLSVISGSPVFQSGRLSRSGSSILWPATANSDRAGVTGITISGTGLTLEAFVSVIGIPYTFGVMLCVYTVGGDNAIINTWAGNGFYAQVNSNNTSAEPINFLLPSYVAMTWDYSTIKLYVNGFLRKTTSCTVTPPAWDRVMLANFGPTPNYAFYGNIMQARVSNIARDDAYIMSTAETLLKM